MKRILSIRCDRCPWGMGASDSDDVRLQEMAIRALAEHLQEGHGVEEPDAKQLARHRVISDGRAGEAGDFA